MLLSHEDKSHVDIEIHHNNAVTNGAINATGFARTTIVATANESETSIQQRYQRPQRHYIPVHVDTADVSDGFPTNEIRSMFDGGDVLVRILTSKVGYVDRIQLVMSQKVLTTVLVHRSPFIPAVLISDPLK